MVVTASEAPAPPALGVAAVARRLGVAPSTLRSWHRRYGIGPSEHDTGSHRRYGPSDVARLELMQRAVIGGVSLADAARHALDAVLDGSARSVPVPGPERGRADGAGAARPPRHGVRGLRMPDADEKAYGLARAALAMNAEAIREALAHSMTEAGVVHTWDAVLRPVLVAIADRWARTDNGVEVEHLLSECALRELDSAATVGPGPLNPRSVLLACVPDEWHSLPLSALAAALAERAVASRLLGAAVPERALHAAVRRSAPAATVLWALQPSTRLDGLLGGLPRTRPACRWFAAGPAFAGCALPAHVTPLTSLSAAVDAVETAAAARRPAPRVAAMSS